MSGVKKMLEEVAKRMEIDDPSDPRVRMEAERLLSLGERRFVVLETHPNSGGIWVGKLGTGSEVLAYLKDLEWKRQLDYVGHIIELKEKADEETLDWLEFEDYQPVGVLVRPVFSSPEGTPPLPGLEKRLAGIEVSAYGLKKSVWSLLQAMTDEEVSLTFSDSLEEMLQRGMSLPKTPEVKVLADSTPCKCHRCDWEGTLGELKPAYQPNPTESGDVIPEPACPVCQSTEIETL